MKRKRIGQKTASHLLWLCTICSALLWGGAGGGLLCSCGDYWEGGDPVDARRMTLGRRVINMMVGDRYRIPVLFEPDTLSNRSVWWMTEDKDVAIVERDTVIALSEGLTLAWAMSVSDHQTDSCWVSVLPAIYLNPKSYPYDMVIYADVSIHGHQYTAADEDSIIIGAYIGDELRGIGKMRQWQGRDYMEIRIWSPVRNGGDISLRCIYRGRALVELFPDAFEFDGEAHGTLSQLYPLVLDDSARQLWPDIEGDDGIPYFDNGDTLHVVVTNPEE